MERFLSQCAKYILNKHKTGLHDVCLVFPNRRAGVFFNSYLQSGISEAIIAPEITTIGELISGVSGLVVADKLQLISLLYDVFQKHTKTNETFDEFYFWGEILLSDFNDIDRYLIHAKDLFRNVSDIKEIDAVFDYLTPEQKKALEHFWGNVGRGLNTGFQQKHFQIWDKLFDIYTDFKLLLQKKKLAFDGMADRQVVENPEKNRNSFGFSQYYFIGLNALNACEKKLFRFLRGEKKAHFLWDYDKFYVEGKNEAGYFMRENLRMFPLPDDFVFNAELFNQTKNIKLTAVSSSYGQAQQIPVFLDEIKFDLDKKFDNTAIVLADESLLFSALGAISPDAGTINITMGYPVKNSMLYGFIMLLANLLKNKKRDKNKGWLAYHRYVTDVLNHQLLKTWANESCRNYLLEIQKNNKIVVSLADIDFSELHLKIFNLPGEVKNYCRYFLDVLSVIAQKFHKEESEHVMLLEIVYAVYTAIEKLDSVIRKTTEEEKREISDAVFFRLLTQYLGTVSVSFEGEPLSGMQVMGILETRCLDFENLIIVGLNEDKWPRTYTAPSFIPANIRKGFGLPGIDEQDAMYAYYFYRLIQRAKNISATYSVVKEGISTGELSRYGFQLLYDSVHQPVNVSIDFSFTHHPVKPIAVRSSKHIVSLLLDRNTEEHPLSPSAINTYMNCSLKFYFRYVLKLPEPDELKEEIDGMIFGNIFHDTIEELYKPFVGKVLDKETIEKIRQNKIGIENTIRKKIAKNYFNEREENARNISIQGKTILIYENIKIYLKQLLKVDKALSPFTMISLEQKYNTEIEIEPDGSKKRILIGGKIDRVDRLNGILRVLDYKTGSVKKYNFNEIEDLFEREAKDPPKEILQAMIYTYVLSVNRNETNIQPAIYSLKKLFEDNFNPDITWGSEPFSFDALRDEFVAQLKMLLAEIYSVNNIFKQTPHESHCSYCAYQTICQRTGTTF